MKKRETFFLLLLPFFLLLNACTDQPRDQLPFAKNSEGYALGLYEGDSIEPKRTFHIQSDTFTKNIELDNMTSQDEKFLLLVLDHDRQIEFAVNGEFYSNYKFSLSSKQSKNIEVELKHLTKGFHSIRYIIIKSPDKEIIQKDQVVEAEQQSQMMNIRVNILQGISTIPSPPSFNVPIDVETRPKGRVHGPFIQTLTNDYRIWLYEKTDSNVLNYRLLYGNQEQFPIDGYVITLLNWKQIPIADDRWSIYDRLEPGMERKVNGNIKIPENRKYSFVAFWLPNPYDDLPDSNPYTNFPFSSLRLNIEKITEK
ncbi:hypothetical protein [Paenibacillus alvei]|uniref:GH16 domain-containing protein n=1 Tax=Paenibacillus alvei TaxID=44250 RepID=A0AAP6ZYJ7_PAEAL|nr:hypothetical protein [Paenibacillus alvei]NEZ42219.1 hypothetical protein [Paenibacillus alvei]NOJ72318.1 hypothetical protein [Paenibacillus alvei]